MKGLRARFGSPIRYEGSMGDMWIATWGDDDAVYCISDDCTGFYEACNSNLAINRIIGDLPPNIQGETINPMSDYGPMGDIRPEDGCHWKANSILSLDGVLYLSVCRRTNGGMGASPYYYGIGEAFDSSIVLSYDHGLSWSPAPDLGKAMFPGHTFSCPYFVQFGKDGWTEATEAQDWIYAVSCKGVWNNGDGMTLGRVRRDRIAALDPADWEFVHGFDADHHPYWRPRHDTAHRIFHAPGRASRSGMNYFEPLDLYILTQWHHTQLDDPARRWRATCMELYHSRKPWGPWNLFHVQHFEPEGWYNPSIPSKYISGDGRNFWLFVAGDMTNSYYYALFMIPVELTWD